MLANDLGLCGLEGYVKPVVVSYSVDIHLAVVREVAQVGDDNSNPEFLLGVKYPKAKTKPLAVSQRVRIGAQNDLHNIVLAVVDLVHVGALEAAEDFIIGRVRRVLVLLLSTALRKIRKVVNQFILILFQRISNIDAEVMIVNVVGTHKPSI